MAWPVPPEYPSSGWDEFYAPGLTDIIERLEWHLWHREWTRPHRREFELSPHRPPLNTDWNIFIREKDLLKAMLEAQA